MTIKCWWKFNSMPFRIRGKMLELYQSTIFGPACPVNLKNFLAFSCLSFLLTTGPCLYIQCWNFNKCSSKDLEKSWSPEITLPFSALGWWFRLQVDYSRQILRWWNPGFLWDSKPSEPATFTNEPFCSRKTKIKHTKPATWKSFPMEKSGKWSTKPLRINSQVPNTTETHRGACTLRELSLFSWNISEQ